MRTSTLEKTDKVIQLMVSRAAHDILSDPDFGLPIRKDVAQKLRRTQHQIKTKSLTSIKQKYL